MYPEPGSNSISTFSCITQTIVPDSVGRTIEQQFQINKRSTRVLWRIVRIYIETFPLYFEIEEQHPTAGEKIKKECVKV